MATVALHAKAATSDFLIGTWIGVSAQTITVTHLAPKGALSGTYFTPEVDLKATFSGRWELQSNTLTITFTEVSYPATKVPLVDRNRLEVVDADTIRLHTLPSGTPSITWERVKFTTKATATRPKPARRALTLDLYRKAKSFEDIDDLVWQRLCALVAEDSRPYSVRVQEMLARVSPSLKRYYLVRDFDWERGFDGLEGCLMEDPEGVLLPDTIAAYEALGAKDHAQIIRELIPVSKARWKAIKRAEREGEEFNYDDGVWEPYEKRWDAAGAKTDFYDVIWKDIKAHPEAYTHKGEKPKRVAGD